MIFDNAAVVVFLGVTYGILCVMITYKYKGIQGITKFQKIVRKTISKILYLKDTASIYGHLLGNVLCGYCIRSQRDLPQHSGILHQNGAYCMALRSR